MNIDPIEAEFFSSEALSSIADALVREAIQNSLDARQAGAAAHVRIAFSTPEQMLVGASRDRYLAELRPHVTADRSGLRLLPDAAEPLGFVVFEISARAACKAILRRARGRRDRRERAAQRLLLFLAQRRPLA